MFRYKIFIAGEFMGAVTAESQENALKAWMDHMHEGLTEEQVADSHHCRVTDLWAERADEKVYS